LEFGIAFDIDHGILMLFKEEQASKGFEAQFLDQGEATVNSTHAVYARLCAMFFILLFSSTVFAATTKVDVCHFPPDDPDNFHTIRISEKAEQSHLNHGDLQGACEIDPEVTCPCLVGDLPQTDPVCAGTETEPWAAWDGYLVCSGDGSSNDTLPTNCTQNASPEFPGCSFTYPSGTTTVENLTADENAACVGLISLACAK